MNDRAVIGEHPEFRPFRDTGYSVSANGVVRSPRGKILRLKRQKNGYLRVSLGCGHDEFVHRMVLIAFRGEPPSSIHETDHDNGCRDDNRLENLFWGTKAENLQKRNCAKGDNHGRAKITEADVIEIKRGPFYMGRDGILAKSLGISREQVRDIRLGKTWKHVSEEAKCRPLKILGQ